MTISPVSASSSLGYEESEEISKTSLIDLVAEIARMALELQAKSSKEEKVRAIKLKSEYKDSTNRSIMHLNRKAYITGAASGFSALIGACLGGGWNGATGLMQASAPISGLWSDGQIKYYDSKAGLEQQEIQQNASAGGENNSLKEAALHNVSAALQHLASAARAG